MIPVQCLREIMCKDFSFFVFSLQSRQQITTVALSLHDAFVARPCNHQLYAIISFHASTSDILRVNLWRLFVTARSCSVTVMTYIDRHLHNDIFGKQKSMSDYGRQQIQTCCQMAEKRPVRSSLCVFVDKTWSLLRFLDIMGDEPEVCSSSFISLRDRSALGIVQHYSDISASSKKRSIL